MDYSDEHWSGLCGGYRTPYDPRQALRALDAGGDPKEAWAELCNELYHQGDVGEASYAAVPTIVRILTEGKLAADDAYSLVTTIEEARRNPTNPPLPSWLEAEYVAAWRSLFEAALERLRTATDDQLASGIIGALAMHKGQPALARMALWFDESERVGLLKEAGWL